VTVLVVMHILLWLFFELGLADSFELAWLLT
jgi:hypothetical protein